MAQSSRFSLPRFFRFKLCRRSRQFFVVDIPSRSCRGKHAAGNHAAANLRRRRQKARGIQFNICISALSRSVDS
jgi:hypothetical protein